MCCVFLFMPKVTHRQLQVIKAGIKVLILQWSEIFLLFLLKYVHRDK